VKTKHILIAIAAVFAWLLWTDGSLTNRGATTSDETKIYITLGGALTLFALYWFFEKGPHKGFLKTRRKRK